MNKILICSHGKLSAGFCDSLRIILGKNDNVDYLTFYDQSQGLSDLEKINKYFLENKDNKLIVLTDVFGGSVNQEVIKQAVNYKNIRIISGLNFPLLLELVVRLNGEITDDDIKEIVEQSKNQIIFFENKKETEFVDDFDI